MAWTTIQGTADGIDEKITTELGGVTSIDNLSVTSIGGNRVVAVIQYTA